MELLEFDLAQVIIALITGISTVSCSYLLYKTSKETSKKEDPKDDDNVDIAHFLVDEMKKMMIEIEELKSKK